MVEKKKEPWQTILTETEGAGGKRSLKV